MSQNYRLFNMLKIIFTIYVIESFKPMNNIKMDIEYGLHFHNIFIPYNSQYQKVIPPTASSWMQDKVVVLKLYFGAFLTNALYLFTLKFLPNRRLLLLFSNLQTKYISCLIKPLQSKFLQIAMFTSVFSCTFSLVTL